MTTKTARARLTTALDAAGIIHEWTFAQGVSDEVAQVDWLIENADVTMRIYVAFECKSDDAIILQVEPLLKVDGKWYGSEPDFEELQELQELAPGWMARGFTYFTHGGTAMFTTIFADRLTPESVYAMTNQAVQIGATMISGAKKFAY